MINLSVNGTILLTAMAGFAVAVTTEEYLIITFERLNLAPETTETLAVGLSLFLGFLMGMVIGGLVAAVIAFSSISLRQSQVAVGFVLTLVCRDLAYFLGNPYMGLSGPRLPAWSIKGLSQIPVIGTIFFRQDLMTYLSFAVILLAWIWIFKTRPGLVLQGVGERPAAAFVRGANVNRQRYFYTILGGALVGLAGPIYSLSVKAGWKGTISGLDTWTINA